MEFWRLYRLVKARIWPILALVAITLVTVYVLKRTAEAQMQYTATALVLPSPKAMNPGGLYNDNKVGSQSPTYDRFSRLAQFVQDVRSGYARSVASLVTNEQGKLAVGGLIIQSPEQQKQEVLQALLPNTDAKKQVIAQLASEKKISLPASLASDDGLQKATADQIDRIINGNVNAVLAARHVPTSPTVWKQRQDLAPDEVSQIESSLGVAPYVSNDVNQTPGGNNPTPTITDYITVSVHSTDKGLAEQVSNLTAAAFINNYRDEGKREYDDSIQKYRDRLADANKKVINAENALYGYQTRTGYIALPSQAGAEIAALEGLRRQRDAAQVQLDAANKSVAAFDQLAKTNGPQQTITLDPLTRPHAQQLQEQLADLKADLRTAQARYTPANPVYQRAKAAVDAKQKELDDFLKQPYVLSQINSAYFNLKNQHDAAVAKAAELQGTVETLDSQIQRQQSENSTRLPAAQRQLGQLIVARDSAIAEQKAAQADIRNLNATDRSLDNGLISLENPASYAVADNGGPTLPTLLIYAAILSLILGIGGVIGLDALDTKVQTIPDAEKLLGMPVSAVIPAFPPGDPRKMSRLVVSEPLSPIAESYRLLRTDLLFTAEDKPFKSLMAATAKPGQGATTTICNLAVALASVGKRVILIDADLRRPKLHDYFGVSNETGLTSLLRGECEMEEALKVTDIDNLLVLPSGPLPLNPSELLASQKMRTLHERLKPHTDFILVDTPSAIAFSDSAILSSFMDAVLLVVRAQESPRGSEVQVKDMLNKARANVVGVVLNGVKPQLVDSYHFHAAYYPQVTTQNGHVLPASNGNGNGHSHAPLPDTGDTLGHRLPENAFISTAASDQKDSTPSGARAYPADGQEDIEATVVMNDIVNVKPQKKGRFNLRSLFGTDHHENNED